MFKPRIKPKKFKPYYYMSDQDLEKLNAIRRGVHQATTLEEIKILEKQAEWLIKKAYVRYDMGMKLR